MVWSHVLSLEFGDLVLQHCCRWFINYRSVWLLDILRNTCRTVVLTFLLVFPNSVKLFFNTWLLQWKCFPGNQCGTIYCIYVFFTMAAIWSRVFVPWCKVWKTVGKCFFKMPKCFSPGIKETWGWDRTLGVIKIRVGFKTLGVVGV